MPVLLGSLNGTYTPRQAVNLIKDFTAAIPLESSAPIVCDMVYGEIWRAFPWRWTLATLTPIGLSDGVQDYANPQADYYRLINPRIARIDLTPNEWRDLDVLQFIAPELSLKGSLESIRAVCYLPQTNSFRFDKAIQVSSGVTLQLQGEYQTVPTRLTEANLDTFTMGFPDIYFDVFVQGILYHFYKLSDDVRAGSMSIDREGRKQINGQAAEYYNRLQDMLRAEDYGDAQQGFFPAEPMGGSGRGSTAGLFGFIG